ncbi:receptor expression-enhancing protein [Striga asiatica]|uniref:HVA22-like protein n=1 Tax=Striga asiatica TaxID=4170 RepID=A0A5A7QAG7_STRAF|nr:receptor expression-enhancing protein [Striga asiatica]
MALFGSNLPCEVGLRLLFYPLGSNVVVLVLWGLSCLFILRSRPLKQRMKMSNINGFCIGLIVSYVLSLSGFVLAAYGSFSVAELFTDKILYWCPLYYHMKFAFLVWMQLPSVDGAKHLYVNYLRPFFFRHQARFDQLMDLFYGEMMKFVSNHETEFLIAKKLLLKIFSSANNAVQEIIHPRQRRGNGSVIEGPQEEVQTSDSESEED